MISILNPKTYRFSSLIIFIFIIGLFISSCKHKNSESLRSVKEFYQKEIFFPRDLPKYYQGKIDTTHLQLYNCYKIITYIDASCQICINELLHWEELITKFQKYNVKFIIIIGNISLETLKSPENVFYEFKYPLYLDQNETYTRTNNYDPIQTSFKTFLLDRNNRVLLTGSPLMSNDNYLLYKKVLDSSFSVIQ